MSNSGNPPNSAFTFNTKGEAFSSVICSIGSQIAFAESLLPQEGTFDIILDSQDQAVCIVEITKVSIQPFHQVSVDHAFKEGEGDKSLAYWRQVHEDCFAEWLREAGMIFTPNSKVVLEEFRKVYPL